MRALIISIAIFSICVFDLGGSNAFVVQPTITSLSATSLSRSGRVIIQGAGFGATQGTGRVEIGGITASTTRWSDTLVVAYVPEATPVGSATVQVVTDGGASNQLTLNVTLRPPASGQVKWRFQADAPYILHRPAAGPDGTVYVYDAYANLYALTPDGALKWIFKAGPVGYLSEVSVGADGTAYVAGGAGAGNTIFAVNPDGTEKWRFSDPLNQGVIAGPNVGPDGKIYAAFDMPGLGAIALSATGQLQWNITGYNEYGPMGEEIAFGSPGQLYFSFDMLGTGQQTSLFGLGFDGSKRFSVAGGTTSQSQAAVGSDGTVYLRSFFSTSGMRLAAFDPGGARRWTFFSTGTSDLTDPGVGADGVVYIGQNFMNLFAINPNGTQKWRYTDAGILFSPIASPLNDLVLMGGRVTYGQPGFFLAVSTGGSALWRVDLPLENGAYIIPYSRPRFSPDGRAAYVGTAIPGQNQANEYCYVYALQTGAQSATSLSSISLSPIEVIGGASPLGTITLTGPAPVGGALVTLSSDDPLAATPPISATVPRGSTSTTFTVTTSPVSAMTFVNLSASYLGATMDATLIVSPAPAGPALSSLTLTPASVQGGATSQGTVTLTSSAPTGGVVVALSSSDTSVATTPASVTVPAGATTATFTVTTKSVTASSSAAIAAALGAATRSAALTVVPPPADTVAIQQAQYLTSKRQLRVSATSTDAAASLSVYVTATGQLIGSLTNNGGGLYSGKLSVASNPQSITVKSSAGGSATRAVTVK